ncbi:TetR/AcrR family transcriptional regulator [Clostridium sp. D2Q-11]|uniref:TetR/AcrR family transcriptional regulator n=1 Tax=Anaeromonas frigoriresistens TaxID=2683708 RepID=A0A942Z894_9FIRM|nr:TetR/AcrR family transcriptional regulator [Anaeromonas frigoriresistens]MBS4538058.1 TetR/AcrR family transcriptional regulator [Anaeromonas frigoriresistens]
MTDRSVNAIILLGGNLMNKQTIQGKETYELLIQCALEIASEGGVKNITAGRLASKAQVSKSNVFNHFKTVDGIFESLFSYLIEYQLRELESAEFEWIDDFIAAISKQICFEDDDSNKFARVFLSFFNESMFSERMQMLFKDYLSKTIDLMQSKIKNCKDNKADDSTVRTIARLIVVALDGFGLHIIMTNDTEVYKKAWKIQIESIAQQLKV